MSLHAFPRSVGRARTHGDCLACSYPYRPAVPVLSSLDRACCGAPCRNAARAHHRQLDCTHVVTARNFTYCYSDDVGCGNSRPGCANFLISATSVRKRYRMAETLCGSGRSAPSARPPKGTRLCRIMHQLIAGPRLRSIFLHWPPMCRGECTPRSFRASFVNCPITTARSVVVIFLHSSSGGLGDTPALVTICFSQWTTRAVSVGIIWGASSMILWVARCNSKAFSDKSAS
jgi:hypothetical protein